MELTIDRANRIACQQQVSN